MWVARAFRVSRPRSAPSRSGRRPWVATYCSTGWRELAWWKAKVTPRARARSRSPSSSSREHDIRWMQAAATRTRPPAVSWNRSIAASVRLSASSAERRSAAGSGTRSHVQSPRVPRIPACSTAAATTPMSRTVPPSPNAVVPFLIISRHESRAEACSSSGVTAA